MVTKKILLALSGGVDSSVAAILLIKQGYYIEGATFSLSDFKQNDSKDLSDAKDICHALNIKYHIIDLNESFKNYVIDPFCLEYLNGKTPNPCIVCNELIKFGVFFDYAKNLGFDSIATGHYARIKNGRLYRAKSLYKDQSYFLYKIPKNKLNSILFPLGEYSKDEIRQIAFKDNLSTHNKSDSQEICFIDSSYVGFIKKFYPDSNEIGYFVDENGAILGKHNGIFNYTIGQRRGLNISLGKRVFVSFINTKTNTITLSDEDKLYKKNMLVENINFCIPHNEFVNLTDTNLVEVKIRSTAKQSSAKIKLTNNTASIEFLKPQRAITNGQSAVFYRGDLVIGGGIISGSF